MFNHLSLRDRFLIAPIISVILTSILYLASNSIISTHTSLFQQLSDSNLPQVSEISRVTISLINYHIKLSAILHAAMESQDEEKVYLKGRVMLDHLHELDKQINLSLGSVQNKELKQVDVINKIKKAFVLYREAVIGGIELSTVDTRQAQQELLNADKIMQKLNRNFLILSDHHVHNLAKYSSVVENSLTDRHTITFLAIVLVVFMIVSSLYFSNRLSFDLGQVNQALVKLSIGEQDIHLPKNPDAYIQQLVNAVISFKQTLEKNDEQQASLNEAVVELEDSKDRYYSLLDIVATAIIVIDDAKRIALFNKAAERTFGYNSEEIVGQSIEKLIPEKFHRQHRIHVTNFEKSGKEMVLNKNRGSIAALRKSGEQFYIEASVTKLSLVNENLVTIGITDITDRMQAEATILRQAHYDALTGLPNRFLSLDRMSQLLKEARRNNELLIVLFLDLDDFKKINDTLGHDTGDKLLIEASNRLLSAVRSTDTVGRLGGDEFIVLLPWVGAANDSYGMMEKILELFRAPFIVDNRELVLTSSIGVSVFPEDGDSVSELLRNADSAMYHAKDLGRNTYSYFTNAMNQKVSRRLALEEQMHGALERNEFRLVYQPKIDISHGSMVGVEALLRWNNPTLGEVFPDEFIPVAEQTGLIVSIGKYVLTEALSKTVQWQQEADPNFQIAVNLSPRQFRDIHLVSFVEKAIQQSKILVECIELEITENVLMSGHSFIDDAVAALKKLGLKLAMDDFGTGYSSLSYLRRYPFDTLKIDRSFISDIIENEADKELVNAAIAMAHGLRLSVVAEGVETKEQLEFLASKGCELAQGYLFSKPVSHEEISEMLRFDNKVVRSNIRD